MAMPEALVNLAFKSFRSIHFPNLTTISITNNWDPLEFAVHPEKLPSLKDVLLYGCTILIRSETPPGTSTNDPSQPKEMCMIERLCHEEFVFTDTSALTLVRNLCCQSMTGITELRLMFVHSFVDSEVDALEYVGMDLVIYPGCVLPNVRFLNITCLHCAGYNAAVFLNHARLPALEKLIVTSKTIKKSDTRTFPSIYRMLAMSRPPLRSMSIYHTPLTADDFLKCLKEVSKTLEKVNARGALFSDEIVAALTWGCGSQTGNDPPTMMSPSSFKNDKPDASYICPRLTRINMYCASSVSLVTSMILSRTANVGVSDQHENRKPAQLREMLIWTEIKELVEIPNIAEVQALVEGGKLNLRVIETKFFH